MPVLNPFATVEPRVANLESKLFMDPSLRLGSFELSQNLIKRITGWSDCDLFEDADIFRPPTNSGFTLQTAADAWCEKRPWSHEYFWSWFKPISDVAPQHVDAEIHQREHPPTYALRGSGREKGSIRVSYKVARS